MSNGADSLKEDKMPDGLDKMFQEDIKWEQIKIVLV